MTKIKTLDVENEFLIELAKYKNFDIELSDKERKIAYEFFKAGWKESWWKLSLKQHSNNSSYTYAKVIDHDGRGPG